MASKYWTQKDGKVIAISDMTDTHLNNAIAMLERIALLNHLAELRACASIKFQGEIAQQEQDRFLLHSSWEDFLPAIYNDLCDEVTNRKIKNINSSYGAK